VRVPLFVNETAELPDPTGLPNFLRGNFHQVIHKSMSLKYEPASEPLHICVK